ncbi:cell division protein FtsX [Helicobacter valdiviensis]|uniref:Cell division protein FtsX n=1 Tax=Helicobacter valdiviensis TaxID=1458358 RepID=A0A2W6PPV5_9HELI|nr:FtsX-like permease family protein [Helicobacter valdiviensis]PZT48753.1 cell division protein FtsX [Helicobacter valdiviensis]
MNSLKNHLALIIPLVALLFSLEGILLIDRILKDYEGKLGKNYAIILASSRELSLEEIQQKVIEAQTLMPIDTQIVLDRLGENISQANLILLKNSLPFFYSLSLKEYPSAERLQVINNTLKDFKEIIRFESFTKSHNQIYQLLLIINSSVLVFASFIALISLLLMFKQIEIWRFQHSERMNIMSLLGAPLWMRNQLLFRLAFLDTLIATLICSSTLIYLSQNSNLVNFMQNVGLSSEVFSPFLDTILLLCVGLALSFVSVWIVSLYKKD